MDIDLKQLRKETEDAIAESERLERENLLEIEPLVEQQN